MKAPFDDPTGHRPMPNPDRILTTVLFTDIVDSTRRAADLGDGSWRDPLDLKLRACSTQVHASTRR